MDFDIFGKNVTDEVDNQKTLYYATSNNLCFCTTGKTGEHENHIFHSIGLCYTHNAPVRCLAERKIVTVMCLIASTFAEIVRYPINSIHWLLLQAWRRTTPISYTATDTVTNLAITQNMWVTDSRMLCSLPRSCLVNSADRFDSEGRFISDQVIFLTVFRVFGEKACSI